MPTQAEIQQAILDALKQSKGYVTAPYLAAISGSSVDAVENFVVRHPEKVRKSQMETDNGEALYTFNSPLSGISDAWSAFRNINAKKF